MFYHEVIMKRDEEMEKRCTVMRDDMAIRLRIAELQRIKSWEITVGDMAEIEKLKEKIQQQ